jgi:m7GpppX diphosphatase
LGKIDEQEGIVLVERTALPSEENVAGQLVSSLASLSALSTNDIYAWFLAKSGITSPPDLKINLIWPSTEKHIAKYSPQKLRMVTETAEIYANQVRPYMAAQREAGRLNWVFNILEGRKEQDDIIYKEADEVDGFLLMPDLNWDRKTLTGMHLLGIVVRRDIWSLRDLKKDHIPWLKHMRQKLLENTVKLYPDIDVDEIKLYIHCRFLQSHNHPGIVLTLQINLRTITSTSMLSTVNLKLALRKRLGKPSASKTSLASWRRLQMGKAWQMSP